MRASQPTITAFAKTALLLLFVVLQSCATYNTQVAVEADV